MFEDAGLRLHEVIVVDDGSTDGTGELVASHDALGERLRLLGFLRNRGKGAAVRAGMLAASGEAALLTDADMATPLEEIAKLAAALERGVDVAIGSRGLPEAEILVRQPVYRERAGKTFNLLLRVLTGIEFRDTQCGFKLYRLATGRVLFERQRIDGFAYDAENVVLAAELGLQVDEIPVRWADDADTRVRLVRSSLRMAVDLLRIAWWKRTGGWDDVRVNGRERTRGR